MHNQQNLLDRVSVDKLHSFHGCTGILSEAHSSICWQLTETIGSVALVSSNDLQSFLGCAVQQEKQFDMTMDQAAQSMVDDVVDRFIGKLMLCCHTYGTPPGA